jgi:lipopolysaccharide transport system ATP-binding protein
MAQINVRNLGKAYKRYPSKWSRLAEWMLPFGGDRHTLNWVLQDLNFTVNPGEAVGIIGVNGAGKSTLLKMISGTSQPTSGSVEMTGKVAALLELGIGFHPDFTGRQNAYMAGQLLGYSVTQITAMMPAIEEFAEIGEYIDQPVRFYSSGMQMRLAFSVATADRPDVLIVDEALSVGDAYFTHKCFDRIREYRKLGTTLLIVSHDKLAIQSICDRAILLNQGGIAMEGEPEAVMDYYNALLADTEGQNIKQVITETGEIQTSSGSGAISVSSIVILDSGNNPIEVVQVGQEISLRVLVEVKEDISSLVLGYIIKDRLGMPIFGSNTHHLNQVENSLQAGEKLEYRFEFKANLGAGSYSIALAAHADDNHLSNNYLWNDRIIQFTVINTKLHFEGVNWMPPRLTIQRFQ